MTNSPNNSHGPSADDVIHDDVPSADDVASDDDIEIEFSDEVAGKLSPDPSGDASELIDQLKDAEGRALRAQAELENFRRRIRREMDEERKFANQPLITELLPAIDNLNRAVSAATENPEAGGLLEGVTMVAQQLLDTLEKFHCKKVEAVGQVFDPNLHEAIQQMPSEYESGKVCLVVQDGYVLHDRVVRPSQAIISTGPPESGAETIS